MDLHHQKVAQEQLDENRAPRSRPITIRTYRQVRAPA
jgi:hypothetical protein